MINNKHLIALNHHLRTARELNYPYACRKVVCADGFTMSVQASENHYCSPRNNEGPWEVVEVGFPSTIEPLLWDYADEPGKWTDTVYGYVPIELVAAVVELHGGIVEQEWVEEKQWIAP
jgi:hypothetical protein